MSEAVTLIVKVSGFIAGRVPSVCYYAKSNFEKTAARVRAVPLAFSLLLISNNRRFPLSLAGLFK